MNSEESAVIGTESTAPGPGGTAPAGPGQDAPQSGASQDWRASLPPELRAALGDDADPAEAAKVYARGKGYEPAQKAGDITLDYGKWGKLGEGVQVHPGLEASFKEFCVAQGITPKQAQKIVEYNGIFSAEASRIHFEQGNAQLEERFGADLDKVRDNALKAFMSLDRKMDGRLSASPGGRQIASDPLVVEALYLIHQVLGEDALGSGGTGAGGGRPMETEAFLRHVLEQQQGARAAS